MGAVEELGVPLRGAAGGLAASSVTPRSRTYLGGGPSILESRRRPMLL